MSGFFEAELQHRIGTFRLEVRLEMDREIGVLFGPSAAGKSLTLRLLSGLEQPKRGRIRLGARVLLDTDEARAVPARRRRIGLVHQDLSLFPHMTVLDNVAYGVRGADAAGRARRWMDRVQLRGVEDRYPEQLSGGQRQRVALARALAPGPQLLLLDEPFSALDGPLRRSLRRELKRLQRVADIPVLYVTHQIEDVSALAARVFLIRDGRVLRSFPVDELWRPGAQETTWPTLGWGTLIRGRLVRGKGVVRLAWAGGELALAGGAAAVPERTGEAVAFVPPQEVKILYPGLAVDPLLAGNTFAGTVSESYLLGHTRTLYVEAGGQHWHVECPAESYSALELGEGSAVRISVRSEAVTLLAPEAASGPVGEAGGG